MCNTVQYRGSSQECAFLYSPLILLIPWVSAAKGFVCLDTAHSAAIWVKVRDGYALHCLLSGWAAPGELWYLLNKKQPDVWLWYIVGPQPRLITLQCSSRDSFHFCSWTPLTDSPQTVSQLTSICSLAHTYNGASGSQDIIHSQAAAHQQHQL